MPEFPIPPEVVEAAKAIEAHRFPDGSPPGISGAHAEELASAALDKLRFSAQYRVCHREGASNCSSLQEAHHFSADREGSRIESRLVADWRPVDSEPRVAFDLTVPGGLAPAGTGVRVDSEPSERRYIWVQPQMVGDLTAWNLAITHKGKQSWRLLTEAIIDGEDALDHDDFWIAEVSDTHLHAIWHSDKERRNEAESGELAAVAAALGIQPSATSEGER